MESKKEEKLNEKGLKVVYTDAYSVGVSVKDGDTLFIGTSKRWIKKKTTKGPQLLN